MDECVCFSLQLKHDKWAPDFGPALFVPSWGATVTGARKFLIAYNVNLISTKEQAHRIALDIREQGRGKDQVHAGSQCAGVSLASVS